MLQSMLAILLGIAVGAAALVILSFAVDALRSRPTPPRQLAWAPDIEIRCLHISAGRVRYIKTGQGPILVLLHTLRTQLDLFEKVVPDLAKDFTVYALDFPGHGYSDIPQARYDAAFFTCAVESFLDSLDLRDVTLAGVSIGASIGLIIASRGNPRVLKVVAINAYDYAKGRGLARSSWLARVLLLAVRVPVLGETVMRLTKLARNQSDI
jgi:pimeloyl-ACP methyl ester carboxylesterase